MSKPGNQGTHAPHGAFASICEAVALVAVPIALAVCGIARFEHTALLCLAVAIASLLLFFAGYERRAPSLRQTMPVVVMAAVAAAGRILFAPLPSVKPVSAIAIIAGAVFGRQAGFLTGALAALVSNFFFGQGPWTPWQMYAWGIIGWLAGFLAHNTHLFDRAGGIYVFGAASGLIFGLFLNLWSILGFLGVQTPAQLAAVWAAAIPFDIVHSVATVIFLVALWAPWKRKLERIKTLYLAA